MRWIAIAMLSATVAHARPGVVQQSPGGGDVEGDVAVHRNDDVPLTLGNTAAAPDAKLLWDTSGTHQLQIWLTDVGGGTDGVPMYWLTGDKTTYFGGDLDLASATSIVENSSGLLKLGGSMTSSHGLGSPNVGVANGLEVNGSTYLDGSTFTGNISVGAGYSIYSGSGSVYGALVINNTYQTLGGLTIGTGTQSNALLIAEFEDRSTNFGHQKPVDPTVYQQSADATDVSQYNSLDWRRLALGGNGGGYGCINETFAYSDMVDGGGASGTYTISAPRQIPDGAVVQRAGLHTLTGFTGDTSATITIGDGTDVDRYNTGTPSVFTTNASGVDLGVPSGTAWHDDAATVTVTITSNADFTSVSAGQATVFVCYWTP